MNFDIARRNMVEQQVRTWEVLEPRVLEVLGTIPREDYVNPRYRKMAYADTPLPLEHGETMMKPVVEGRLLQALNPQSDEAVLEIGTGSGYLTACLGQLAGRVVSVDCQQDFTQSAQRRLAQVADSDVTIAHADAFNELDMGEVLAGQTFDAVAVTGSAATIPEAFRRWLKPGGRLFMVRGNEPAMEACLIRAIEGGQFAEESLFETDLGRLQGAEDRAKFVF
ncbi:MAG: protein-L-isoaspartate O-methyltransferase [Lysobacterales bacterium]